MSRWQSHPWKHPAVVVPRKQVPPIDSKRVMGMSDQGRNEAVRQRMVELEIEQEARRELRRQREAERAQRYFGGDRFHAAPDDMTPAFRRRRKSSSTFIARCEECGHSARVIVSLARVSGPLRLRCSRCGTPQEM